MLLQKKVENELKSLIVQGFAKEDIIEKMNKKYGQIQELLIWHDCCYNTICKELGINRKKGEEIKVKRARANRKVGK